MRSRLEGIVSLKMRSTVLLYLLSLALCAGFQPTKFKPTGLAVFKTRTYALQPPSDGKHLFMSNGWGDKHERKSGKKITPLSTTEDDGYSLRKKHGSPFLRNLWNRLIVRKSPGSLILIRHGESEMNSNGTFTGWIDCDMGEDGIREMEDAARLIIERGYQIDITYTSRLKRAIRSVWTILKKLDQVFRPVYKSWRLNERCYGAMEGRSKAQLALEIGEEKVQEYRKSLTARPPAMTEDHPHWHRSERKYSDLAPDDIPVTESVADCLARTLPLWENRILPELISGRTVMVVAHANSLRGLVQHIDSLSEADLKRVYVPNGVPLVYKFDANMKPIKTKDSAEPLSSFFLGDGKALSKKIDLEKKWGSEVPGFESLARSQSSVWSSTSAVSSASASASASASTSAATTSATAASADDDSAAQASLSGPPSLEILPKCVLSTFDPDDPYLVLIRHGKTENNKLGIFTGWDDAPLAPEGRLEAKKAGKLLKLHGIEFDVVYTSWLSRAIETAWTVLDELDLLWLPIIKSWRLNERMYGQLTGMSKKMIAEKFGSAQFKKWRRGFDTQPPAVNSFSQYYPGNDDRYSNFVVDVRYSFSESLVRSFATGSLTLHRKFPKTESLKDCMARTIPYYTNVIVPKSIKNGERVLIASSENAIRGLLMHLCDIPRDRISEVEIPTGLPMVYSFKRRCIRLLDDGQMPTEPGADPLARFNFGTSPELLFKPCADGDDSCILTDVGRSYSLDPVIRFRQQG